MIKHRINRLSTINMKILMIVLLAVLCAVSLCSGAVLVYITGVLRVQALEEASKTMDQAQHKVNAYMEELINYSSYIMLSEQFQLLLLNREKSTGVDYHTSSRDLKKLLTFYTLLWDKTVDNIFMVFDDGTVISGRPGTIDMQTQWYQQFSQSSRKKSISGRLTSSTRSQSPNNQPVFSYAIKVVNSNDLDHQLGIMVLHIKYDYLQSQIAAETGMLPGLALVDDGNIPVVERERYEFFDFLELVLRAEPANKSSEITKLDSNYIFYRQVEHVGWSVYGILPDSWVDDQIQSAIYILFFIFAASLVFLVLVFLPAIYKITSPLNTLVSGMKQVSRGDFQTRIEINSNDELKDMAELFNKMVRDVRRLLDESVKNEKQEQELRMKLFMAQINPHFICNTLNTIIHRAQAIGAEEIVEITRAFVNILQVTINHDQNMYHTIADEMEYIENYMLIIRCRYGELAKVAWDVDKAAMGCVINRMLLYPLVENSLFHGFFHRRMVGEIRVSIQRANQFLQLAVSDNGQGMTPQRLREVRRRIEGGELPSKGRVSIGLQNVHSRLRLYYGEHCGIQIESSLDAGTTVRFQIPESTVIPNGEEDGRAFPNR